MKPPPSRRAGPGSRVAAHSGHVEVAMMIVQSSSLVAVESGLFALSGAAVTVAGGQRVLVPMRDTLGSPAPSRRCAPMPSASASTVSISRWHRPMRHGANGTRTGNMTARTR